MNSIRHYIRNIKKHKIFSAITIGSFSISIAIILLLSAFLISEYGYDKHIKNIDRIYRIKASENRAGIPEQSRDLILSQVPEVEAVTLFNTQPEPVVYNQHSTQAKVINSDEEFFKVLSISFVAGQSENVFNDKYHTVITERFARKLFGDEDPIGKVINVSHRENITVAAVIKDFPEKSSLNGDLICSAELKLSFSRSCYNDKCTFYYNMLVLLNPDIASNCLDEKLTAIIPKSSENDKNTYSLIPYKNVYFDTSLSYDNHAHANIKLIRLLVWLTIALLLLSVFNYINLSIAHNTTRLKEIGIKQTLGARQSGIFILLIYEAFYTTLIATILAFAIAFLLHPVFAELLGKAFSLSVLTESPILIFSAIGILVIISLSAAIYPAYLLSKYKARNLIQNQVKTKNGGFDIRKSLNIIQFAATIILLVCLMIITRQINYVKNTDFGFDTEQLLRINLHWKAADKIDLLKDKINAIPGVKSSCYTHGTPGGIYSYNNDDKFGKISNINSDYSFLETFGLSVIKGRNFYPDEKNRVCLINKTALQQAEWDNFEGKTLFGSEVVGLLDDFHFENLYHEIGALMIVNDLTVSHFNVRIYPQNIPQSINAIKEGFKEVLPDYEFSYQFYDDYLNSMYKQEEKRATTIRIISLIAIFLSCIGLIGLVEFSSKRRIKEIGIRKVNGAKITEILALLNTDFIKWVAIAFVIATPIAYFAMHKWLENFAYKTELSWWIFALAGLLALGIALLTVSWQSWRAATRNPVEALRYE